MLLKLDVLNGKYNMDLDKYIDLAAYSLQVDGDFDPGIHSLEYLRTLKLLPQVQENGCILATFCSIKYFLYYSASLSQFVAD